ncbi:MAG: catalase, partial [Solirubrobacteraceae bacterium]
DGNWDLVGNNLGVFFIRDAIKFPDFIHTQKPDPVTFKQEPERFFDFWASSPEAMHMITLLFSPRGVPASYRFQQGFGVNTYKWVNEAGESILVKYHWLPKQGVKSWTSADAAAVQAEDLGPHTDDLYTAIEANDFPQWDLHVQMMSDEEHPELDFDPLDDTKVWPENDFPLQHVGTMTLNRNVSNFFEESEQIAFGTGVLVDGLDFSDDKMLVGRTFSYSDTQRYRVGPNYLQLKVNAPKTDVRTNQRDGQMAYGVDDSGENPHVNYEPSYLNGLVEADNPGPVESGPLFNDRLTRARIPLTADYKQAGQRYQLQEDWEREELIANFIDKLSGVSRPLQERMVWHFLMCDSDYGKRIGEGIGVSVDDVKGLDPLPTQTLSDEEEAWRANLGENAPRDVEGLVMTHCVPNERDVRVPQDGSGNGHAVSNGHATPAKPRAEHPEGGRI